MTLNMTMLPAKLAAAGYVSHHVGESSRPGAATSSLPLAGLGDAAPSPVEKPEEAPREQALAEYVIPEFAIGGQ